MRVLGPWPILSLLLLSTAPLFAQQDTTLQLDMQLRVRSEWRDGYKLASANNILTRDNLVTVQRARLGLKGRWRSFDYKLAAQDIRTFGGPTGQSQGTLGITEAWWSSELAYGLVLKVGRQEIKFDNERVVGAVDWSNPGRFLDGVRLDRQKDRPDQGNSTAALTWDELTNTLRVMLYHRAMVGQGNKLTLLLFGQDSEIEPNLLTFGFTTRFKVGDHGYVATEAYAQPHKFQHSGSGMGWGNGRILKFANMLIADVGRKGEGGHEWQMGLDLLSYKEYRDGFGFHPFLGTNHRHYGWMDQFYVGTQTPGLTDVRLRHTAPLNVRPFPTAKGWGAAFHHFRTAGFGDLLGNELDLWITGKKDGALTWHVGWSLMDVTPRHVERQNALPQEEWSAAAARLQQWGWVSLNFTPSFDLR